MSCDFQNKQNFIYVFPTHPLFWLYVLLEIYIPEKSIFLQKMHLVLVLDHVR